MVKYIGSKRVLAPVIERVASLLPIRSVCDLFAGTTRIGQAFRRAGIVVHSNDTATYSEALGHAYVVAGEDVDRVRLRQLLAHLGGVRPEHGYFTETFCIQSRYFQPHNGMRVDAIRAEIDRLSLTAVERGLLLTSLLEAADRVDSTCGLQMAYVKQWAPRSFADLQLREPAPVPGPPGTVTRIDANELAPRLAGIDCVYLDPPYNQHSYFSNYHIWETLMRWDAPETYGIACKRIDCRTTKSPYNSKRVAWQSFSQLIEVLLTPWIVVSFNNEGYHDLDLVAALLGEKGYVRSVAIDFKRYVGAQIGIYNPNGQKVGRVSHLRNKEVLFISGPDEALVEQAADVIRRPSAVAVEQEVVF
ncbi:MAG: DNA adenine methylase [Gaiellaceae bacterium MAG52_C11]|nr:DNA adenine methylase [Candidatus Gaiellasilicea maunaloa]